MNEFKIVVTVKANRALIGIQSPATDPYFTKAEGNIHEIMANAEKAVADAEEKWKTQPKYPVIDLPQPETSKETAPVKSTSSKGKAKPVPDSGGQVTMF